MADKNSLQKSGDDCKMGVGRGVETLETSGFVVKKVVIQFLDSWSLVALQVIVGQQLHCKLQYVVSCQGNVKIGCKTIGSVTVA